MLARTVSIALLLASGNGIASQILRNPDIKTDVQVLGDDVAFTFGFKDNNGTYLEWSWRDSLSRIDVSSKLFGLKERSPENLTYDPQNLANGLFRKHPTLGFLPDYSALVSRYYDSVNGLYEQWHAHVASQGLSPRQSIEVLLAFLQDFPYGNPPLVLENRKINGLFVPPLIFKNGWGDCDSKSLLMAAVLSHQPEFRGKLAMILVPGHALLGIETQPGPYDELYQYQNRKFVIAEPTGLSKTPLGRRNSPYSEVLAVDPITVNFDSRNRPVIAEPPLTSGVASEVSFDAAPQLLTGRQSEGLKVLTPADCPTGSRLGDITSTSGIRVQSCYFVKDGAVVKNGPEVRFNSADAPAERHEYDQGNQIK